MAGAATALACLSFGAGRTPALGARASTPPPKAFLVNVANASIGGLRLNQQFAAFAHAWGLPDYAGALESEKTTQALWSRTTKRTQMIQKAWATVTLRTQSSTRVSEVRFAGLFRTTRGDRRGTSLATFLRHWRKEGYLIAEVRRGRLVEYNVLVRGVLFAFDHRKTLQAVSLVARAKALKYCAIPSFCLMADLR